MSERLTAAELEVLFLANTDDVTRAEKVVKTAGERIEKKHIKATVDGDAKGAVAAMQQVEDAQKRIVTAKTAARVDADISSAEKQFVRLYEKVDYLRAIQPEMQVDADITRAVKQMERAQARLDGLRGARAVMEVDADTKPLEDATDGVGEEAGDKVGGDVEKSLIAALTAIPIAGGIILAGKAIGGALINGVQAGMQIDARQDRLAALTGLDETQARRFGIAAGESYAQNFGESIESNMNTARLGLQFNILGTNTSTRDAEMVISRLGGLSDILEEDVKRTAETTSVLLRTGLAPAAKDAFDLIAVGEREGLNRSSDLLDTLTEYPVVLRKLGLSGADSLGLLSQGLKDGARNTDVIADALKEFQIRATDGSDSSKTGFERLGLDATDMTARIARGGAEARAGLDEVLRKLRETEDPVKRNAAAVELFGTKAEDLGDALFALDLSTAADSLGQVQGAAEKMFATLADNDAAKLDQAKRNVEIGIEGIQGALAAGFSEPLQEAAEWVSQNRGPVLEFFRDMANGAFAFADALVEGLATGTENIGQFVSGPLADLTQGLGKFIGIFDVGAGKGLLEYSDQMRGFDDAANDAADQMRTNLGSAIDEARGKLNEYIEPAIQIGYLNDATQRTARSVAELGSEHSTLHQQITDVVAAMTSEIEAAAAAGENQDELKRRYDETTQALVDQMLQMGYTEEQARRIIETYGAVPSLVPTTFEAHTQAAEAAAQAFTDKWSNKTITFQILANARIGGGELPKSGPLLPELLPNARGNVLTPMSGSSATIVPPGTWRVVGDRMDVGELFAPLDGSPRSWALIQEGIRRMPGVMPMADGGIVTAAATAAGAPSVSVGPIDASVVISPREAELRAIIIRVIREYNDTQFAKGGA